MSLPISSGSPDEQRPSPALADRVTASTTRLILIAIVAGGLLTAALNLRRPGTGDSDEPLNPSVAVAPIDHFLSEGLPVGREIVRGDEAAARAAVVRLGRAKIAAAVKGMNSLRTSQKPVAEAIDPLEDTVELASDPGGKWSIRQLQDLRRMIIGVSLAGPEPTVLFWGGYDETGPDEWTVWTVLLPVTEK